MFVTDEFNSAHDLHISQSPDDRTTLSTSPRVASHLANEGVLDPRYVDTLLTH